MQDKSYIAVKEDIEDYEISIQKFTKSIRDFTAKIDTLNKQKKELISKLDDRIDKASADELNKLIAEKSKEFDGRLAAVVQKRSKLQENYDSKLATITFDNYKAKYGSKDLDTNELVSVLNEAKESIIESVGERFEEELSKQLDTKKVNINEEEIPLLTKRFRAKTKELKIFSTFNNFTENDRILSLKDRLISLTTPFKDDAEITEDKVRKTIIIYTAVFLGINLLIFTKFALPALVIIVVMFILKIYKNNRLYTLYLECKLVMDNLEEIEKRNTAKINKIIAKHTKQLEDKYKDSCDKLDATKNKIDADISSELATIRSNFKFDDSKITKEIREEKIAIDGKIAQANNTINDYRRSIEESNSAIEELKVDLDRLLKVTVDKFISYDSVGTEVLFDGKYIWDIVDNDIQFFTHPKTSMFIICANKAIRDDFIRLLLLQTNSRYDVTNFTFDIYDIITSGHSFLNFSNRVLEKSTEEEPMCNTNIYVTEDNVIARLADLHKEFLEIQPKIDRQGSIEDYNRLAKEQGSFLAPYRFLLHVDSVIEKLGDRDMLALINSGARYGYYSHLFVTVDELQNNVREYEKVYKAFPNYYSLAETKLRPISKGEVEKLLTEDK